MTDITIRRGRSADLPEVIVMADSADSAAHWTTEDYAHIFQSPRTLLIAEQNGTIVGFIVAFDVAGDWELENVAVAPGHRRRGIARKLMDSLIEAAGESGAKAIFLEVRESNIAAKSLYERCGFQRYGRRRDYYANPSEDGLLYRFLCSSATREKC